MTAAMERMDELRFKQLSHHDADLAYLTYLFYNG
jgi:hypothetical protein